MHKYSAFCYINIMKGILFYYRLGLPPLRPNAVDLRILEAMTFLNSFRESLSQ